MWTRARISPFPLRVTRPARSLSIMCQGRPNITLYTDATPNGIKASIALEELGVVYLILSKGNFLC
jgi:hypothetical protein